jgi:hypothetical protein
MKQFTLVLPFLPCLFDMDFNVKIYSNIGGKTSVKSQAISFIF